MNTGEQVTIVFIALLSVSKLIDWVLVYTRGHQKQEQADAAERGRWMDVLETVLNRQQDKFKELAGEFREGMTETVSAMQKNMTDGLEQLVVQVETRMAEVSTTRTAKLELMHTDLKTIPNEVQRILVGDLAAQTTALQDSIAAAAADQEEAVREAVTQALKPVLAQIEEKLEQLPGETAARRIMREEIKALEAQLVDQVAAQVKPLLEKFNEIAAALDKLPSREHTTREHGDQAGPSDPSVDQVKEQQDHVGNPSG